MVDEPVNKSAKNFVSKSLLELTNTSISLGGEQIIKPLAFKVHGGEIVSIMGPSGSGKSTLLNFICGNLVPAFSSSGKVILNSQDITSLAPEKRRVGILFQDDLLFPNMSVKVNLAFGIPEEVTRGERNDIVQKALEDAGMSDYGSKDPATLSGGQRARIALMRALLARPQALLLDEPFNKLDADLRQRFRKFVFTHTSNSNIPCVLVTHDLADAKDAGGKIIKL